MPLLKLETSMPVPEKARGELIAGLSRILAETTGKPERYVMVTLAGASILMGGTPGPAAFVDIRGIGGLTGKVNRDLSAKVCALLVKSLEIPSDRVYLNFTDVAASNWGWDSKTFG